jgi:hypothetical protein
MAAEIQWKGCNSFHFQNLFLSTLPCLKDFELKDSIFIFIYPALETSKFLIYKEKEQCIMYFLGLIITTC